jgi:bacterioferritin
MRGIESVITVLNAAIKAETTAINQYVTHAEMYENCGYGKLAKHEMGQAKDEMKHLSSLTARILFLEGVPRLGEVMPLNIGRNAKERLENDRKLEEAAVTLYNRAVKHACDAGDNGTRELLAKILESEEEHLNWQDSQLEQIAQMGLENYLAQQVE